MTVYHLNCGTMYAYGFPLDDNTGGFLKRGRGHSAVALRMDDRWLMHCGDAYTYNGQVDLVKPYVFPSGKLMEIVLMTGFRIPKRHRAHIRELVQAHGGKVQTFCAHDAHEFDRCKSGSWGR